MSANPTPARARSFAWRTLLPPLAVGLLALAVRAAFLLGIEAYPKFELIRNRLDDQVFFHTWAVSMVQERPLDLLATGHEFAYWAQARPGVFPQDPLYAWALAAVYRTFGFEFDLVRWSQAVLGALAAALTCLLASRLMRWPAALVAGLAVALYGPLVFYEATFLREAPAAAACVVVIGLLDAALRKDEPAHARAVPLLLLSGLVLGLAVLLRSNLLLFALGAAAWVWWASGSGRMLLACTAAAALPVLPVVALNTARSGRPALVSSSGSYNFFVGNVHDATGDGKGSWAQYEAVKASGPPETISLYRQALADIAAHPAGWLKLEARKLLLFFSPRDLPDNLSYPMGRRCNPRLLLAPVEMYLLLPPAVVGLAIGGRRWRRLSLLYLFLALYAVSVVLFFVVSRLQLPVVPVLAVFAGLAFDAAWTAVRQGRAKWAAAGAALALAAALALRPPLDDYRPVDAGMAAAAYFSRGLQAEAARLPQEARRFHGRAVAFNPDHGAALGRIAALGPAPAGQPRPEAVELCERARKASAQSRFDEARQLLQEARRLEPEWAVPYQYLANVDFLAGERRAALRHLERAVEMDPLNLALRTNLKALQRQVRGG
jgi:4-amino-4-deoxy-L-arabinose transferase-like glycosyltransferase